MRSKGTLIIGFALALFFSGSFAGTQTKQKSLGVFPTGLSESAFSPEGLSLEEVGTKLIEDQLRQDKRFSVVPFTRSHPAIQRALKEGSVSASALAAPFTGRSQGEYRAVRLGRLMRVELAIASMIDSYDYDAAKSVAKIVVTYELYDVKQSKLIGSVALTAEGKADPDSKAREESTAARAALSAMVSKGIPQAIEILTKPPKTGGS